MIFSPGSPGKKSDAAPRFADNITLKKSCVPFFFSPFFLLVLAPRPGFAHRCGNDCSLSLILAMALRHSDLILPLSVLCLTRIALRARAARAIRTISGGHFARLFKTAKARAMAD